jgi:hypothetical protein
MRTEAASNPTCDHFGFSCRQRILPDLSNLPGRAGGTPVGLGAFWCPRPQSAHCQGIKRAAEHYGKRFASPLSGISCLQMASTTFRQDAGGAGHSGRQGVFGFLMHGGQSE